MAAQQQGNANAAAAAPASQAMRKETTRLAGEHKGGCATSNFYVEGTAVLRKKIIKKCISVFLRVRVYLKRCVVSLLAIMCVSPLSVLLIALCVRFVPVRDAETRRAWQQQQANANAAAEAALQAQKEETTRRAGDYKGGSRNAKYYSAGVLCTEV